MTTAIGRIDGAQQQRPATSALRRVASGLAALVEGLPRSSRYYDQRLAEELEAAPAEQRIDIVLRWHARQGRVV